MKIPDAEANTTIADILKKNIEERFFDATHISHTALTGIPGYDQLKENSVDEFLRKYCHTSESQLKNEFGITLDDKLYDYFKNNKMTEEELGNNWFDR